MLLFAKIGARRRLTSGSLNREARGIGPKESLVLKSWSEGGVRACGHALFLSNILPRKTDLSSPWDLVL